MPELPFPAPEPHPKETIEMILKTMEKIPGDAPLDSQMRLADIGFVKEDFKPFETYCRNAFRVKPYFGSSTEEHLAQNGTVDDLEEKVVKAVQNSKIGSLGDD
ncbi:hypothetical protein G6514_003716 [Epicoccum nigrum]|nr:hypothetical protein G6514_003716 [Epicoccum nigrum]